MGDVPKKRQVATIRTGSQHPCLGFKMKTSVYVDLVSVVICSWLHSLGEDSAG
jgi:hypothetical protein